MIAEWTRMLRLPDQFSHGALLLGMRSYKPDAEKAAFYNAQALGK